MSFLPLQKSIAQSILVQWIPNILHYLTYLHINEKTTLNIILAPKLTDLLLKNCILNYFFFVCEFFQYLKLYISINSTSNYFKPLTSASMIQYHMKNTFLNPLIFNIDWVMIKFIYEVLFTLKSLPDIKNFISPSIQM